MSDAVINDWCDEHLPQMYTPSIFDSDEQEEAVLSRIDDLLETEVLPFMEEPDEVFEAVHDAALTWLEEHHYILMGLSADTEDKPARMDEDKPARMDESDLNDWCDDHLPHLYNPSMFDKEDISHVVWDALDELLDNEVLPFIEDASAIREEILEAAEVWFTEHHAALINAHAKPVSPEQIAAILNRPQVPQHTPEWYAERYVGLTASEYKALFCGSRGALLRSKLAGLTATATATSTQSRTPVAISMENGEMNATLWGHRFEPVVRDIYELEVAGVDTVCDTLGRLTHLSIPWLKASPDGLVVRGPLAGRIVEIKAPKTRVPGEFVPDEYWMQMQVQMEVMDLDAVDFLEAQFTQRHETMIDDSDKLLMNLAPWKGRIRVFGHLHDNTSWVYRYSRPAKNLEESLFDTTVPLPTMPLLEDSIWWISGWFPRTVLRDTQWWTDVGLPAGEQFWVDVHAAPLTLSSSSTPIVVERVQWMGRATVEDENEEEL